MKLAIILNNEGQHVWLFTRDTPCKTHSDAHRRLQAYKAQDRFSHVSVEANGVILTDPKTYASEPALVVNITHRKKRAA